MTALRITALALIALIYGPPAAIGVGLLLMSMDGFTRHKRPTRAA